MKDPFQLVKNLPAMQETRVPSLGWEGPMEKGKTTHSSILAWRIPEHWVAKSRFPAGSAGEESACNVGDVGLIPQLGRSPGEGKGYHSSILAWRILWTV